MKCGPVWKSPSMTFPYFNLKLDEVMKWYYIHLTLAACWQVEDRLDPTLFLKLAQSILPNAASS